MAKCQFVVNNKLGNKLSNFAEINLAASLSFTEAIGNNPNSNNAWLININFDWDKGLLILLVKVERAVSDRSF